MPADPATLALTTVAQDAGALADAALDLALRRTQRSDEPHAEVVVAPHLVVPGTTAALAPGR